jgi:hypothetical protein
MKGNKFDGARMRNVYYPPPFSNFSGCSNSGSITFAENLVGVGLDWTAGKFYYEASVTRV